MGKKVNATVSGKSPNQSGGSTDGETGGVGSRYSLDIAERDNKAQTRNQSVTGKGSQTWKPMANVSMASRKTGRL